MPVPVWLLAAGLESEVLASLAAGLGLYLGIVWGRALFRQPAIMLGFLRIGGTSLLLLMSLGWLMAQFFNLSSLERSLSAALEMDIGTSLPAYASAVAYVLVFAAVLGSLGNLSLIRTLEANAVDKLMAARGVRANNLLIMIGIICTLEIWLILSGVISYRTYTIVGFDEGQIAWYLPMLQLIFSAQVGLNALAISQMARRKERFAKMSVVVVAASVLLVMFVNFTRGRADFILCALLHLYWTIFFVGRTPKIRTLATILLISFPMLYSGALLNNFMRSSAARDVDLSVEGFGTFFFNALDVWQEDATVREFESARSSENLATRPLVAHPLALSMALPDERKSFLLGENLVNSAVWAIPSALVSNKKDYPIQEDLLYANFPIGTEDTADSAYLYAYADFGYVGVFIYPLILTGIWICVLLLSRLSHISSLGVLVLTCAWIPLFTLFLGESAMTTWFSLLRNTVIALPFVVLLANFFRFPSRSHNT